MRSPSIISRLTQWGATLVIQLRERERDLFHHGYAGTLKLVMEALLNGEATGEARVLLSSAKLVALRKPNGKLRPIAMGDALRKLAMTLLCTMHREEFDIFFTAPLKPGHTDGAGGGGAGGGGACGGGAGGGGAGGGGTAGGGVVVGGDVEPGRVIAARSQPVYPLAATVDATGSPGAGDATGTTGVAVQLGMSKGGTEIAAKAISSHLELWRNG